MEPSGAQALYWQSAEAPGRQVPFANGAEINWLSVATERAQGEYTAALLAQDGGALCKLTVMKSENLRVMYLFSDDPARYGRAWVEDCPRHENEATASMVLLGTDGRLHHAGTVDQLRGRGNGTWGHLKKAYQLKLRHKDDLLDTGLASKPNRTWVLLAETMDYTLLHNRITFDLALEMGLTQTSHSEHIDLYYDGEYRGTYLLCEKVEINEGRIDIPDYEKVLDQRNAAAGVGDPEALAVASATNRYGNRYTYIDGVVETDDPGEGSYLLEMESETTLSDRCWFQNCDAGVDDLIAVKNPENASANMMRYISEALEDARQALLHRGVNPETGLGVHDYFDVDAFARMALIQELSCNTDGYAYSSSFFVLPAGSRQFHPGPVWDFDLAYRTKSSTQIEGNPGLKEITGWLPWLYSAPEFALRMQELYESELYPIVTKILLGTERGVYLRPLDEYAAEIAASRRMNYKLWSQDMHYRYIYGETYESDFALLKSFLKIRNDWLYQRVMAWTPDHPNRPVLLMSAIYTQVEASLKVELDPEWMTPVCVRSYSAEQLTEATETDYAVWRMEAILEPLPGYAFGESVQVTLNETPVDSQFTDDGALKIVVLFEDESYRPVDYEGEDWGLVYNADVYAANHPQIAKEFENDPDGLLAYFVEEGVYEGQVANAFFSPGWILFCKPDLEYVLGESWELYYQEFIYAGYVDWMLTVGTRFYPRVRSEPVSPLP